MEDFFWNSRDRIDQVLQDEIEIAEIKTIPEIHDFPFRNGFIETSVLFVDLRGSLDLTEEHRRSTAARIHKCFLNEMVHAARYWNGKIGRFAGNKIMVLSNADGRQANRAIDIAITMQTIVEHILSPRLEKIYKEKVACGIGIDLGKILVAKVDNNHELIWAGGPTDVASKLADEAKRGEIRVTDRIYDRLRDDLRKPGWWERMKPYKVLGKNETVYCNYGLYKPAVENISKKDIIVL